MVITRLISTVSNPIAAGRETPRRAVRHRKAANLAFDAEPSGDTLCFPSRRAASHIWVRYPVRERLIDQEAVDNATARRQGVSRSVIADERQSARIVGTEGERSVPRQ